MRSALTKVLERFGFGETSKKIKAFPGRQRKPLVNYCSIMAMFYLALIVKCHIIGTCDNNFDQYWQKGACWLCKAKPHETLSNPIYLSATLARKSCNKGCVWKRAISIHVSISSWTKLLLSLSGVLHWVNGFSVNLYLINIYICALTCPLTLICVVDSPLNLNWFRIRLLANLFERYS